MEYVIATLAALWIGYQTDRWLQRRAWRAMRQQRARVALEDGLWGREN